MAAVVAEKFLWLSKTFSGSFLPVVYPSQFQVKLKGKLDNQFKTLGCHDFRWYPSQFLQTLVFIFA